MDSLAETDSVKTYQRNGAEPVFLRSCACCVCLITACVPLALAAADEPVADRYRAILERNAFGLKPPVSPSEDTGSQSPEDLPQIRLTGIYARGELIQVFLVKEPRGQEPVQLSLAMGEVRDGVELIEANARDGSALLRIAGTDLPVSFHGQRAAETAARVAEVKFVEDHIRAHEEQQRRLQQQLAAEAAAESAK
jgi:hypothetical protein